MVTWQRNNITSDPRGMVLLMEFALREIFRFRRFQNSGLFGTFENQKPESIWQRNVMESPDTMSEHHTSNGEVQRSSGSLPGLDFVNFSPSLEISGPGLESVAADLSD